MALRYLNQIRDAVGDLGGNPATYQAAIRDAQHDLARLSTTCAETRVHCG